MERARDKERKWGRDRERTRAGQLSTKWKQRICDKEYLSVPVVYCPQGAGWTFQLALFLSHSPCTSPLNRVKSACLQMEIDGCCLHHHPQASGVWAFFASLSESGPVCKLPTDESKSCELCMLYYFFKRRTSQQKSLQSYRKAKKKVLPPKCHNGFSSFIIHLKRMIIFSCACIPHTHFSSFHWEDFTLFFWPLALPPRASFTQGRYRDVIKRTNHLGSSPEDNHPPTPSFLWLHLQRK